MEVKWLSEWDQNTKFLNSLLNYRRSKSSIDKLEFMDGSITSASEEIESTIVEFFKKCTVSQDRGWRIEVE